MSQITGGLVRYERKVNLGNYEHKVAAAEITFGVSEGHDHRDLVAQAEFEAQASVERLLGGTVAKPAPTASMPVEPVATMPKATEPPAERTRGPGRPRKQPAAPDTAPPAAEDALDLTSHTTDPLPGTRQDATLPGVLDTALGLGTGEPAAPATPATDDLSDLGLETAAEPEITDKELSQRVMAKNQVLMDPLKIRQLIGTYIAPPGMVKDIPQAKRGAFLRELDALKK